MRRLEYWWRAALLRVNLVPFSEYAALRIENERLTMTIARQANLVSKARVVIGQIESSLEIKGNVRQENTKRDRAPDPQA